MATRVCVVGLGYIGLPTACMFASRGLEVVGCDINPAAVDAVNAGRAHFKEPDLEMLLEAAVNTGRLRAQTVPEPADYFVLAVPTPFDSAMQPDLSYVDAATSAIAPLLNAGNTVILESTSPVGTTERLAQRLSDLRPDLVLPKLGESGQESQVSVAHCPERILPGQMVRELVSNDRIVGGLSELCSARAISLYEYFVKGESFVTDCRTAEFVKLVENSFRDVNIAFANEVSMICERLDIDVWSAISLANRHPRVNILKPGPGVGGHCIAVDPWFIVASAPDDSRLIRAAREINSLKTEHVFERICRAADRFRDPVVACFGLTYKNDVEDLRESPALEIATKLAKRGGVKLLVCDPMLEQLPAPLDSYENVALVRVDEARSGADIVAILVAHRQFKRLDPKLFLNKIVVDAVGLLSDR